MKKGLLSILAGALLVVGCQNYDDQFDALESQINALASTVAGLSQVQSDLASLSATVGSLQGALQSGIDAALADGLADIDAAVADLEAATANAASAEDVQAIQDGVDANQTSLAELLAQSSVFQGNVVVNTPATLDAYHAMGDGLAIVNGYVDIDVSSTMDIVKVQEFVDFITVTTGDFAYTALTDVETEVTFNNLAGTASLTLDQEGGYQLKALESATNIVLDDDSSVSIVHLGSLISATSLKDDASATAGEFSFSKATELHLTSLPRSPHQSLQLGVDEGGVIDISALTDTTVAGKAARLNLTLDGPDSVTISTLSGDKASSSVSLTNIINATVNGYDGNITIGEDVQNFTADNIVSITVTGNDLVSFTGTGALDPNATTADTAGPALSLSSQGDLETATIDGTYTTVALGSNGNLVTATIGGTVTGAGGVSITSNSDLTTLDVSALTTDYMNIDGNSDLEALTVNFTAAAGEATTQKGTIIVNNNESLESLTIGTNNIDILTITNNADLESIDGSGLTAIGATGKPNVTITNNDLNASVSDDENDSFTTASGMETLKAYLTAVAADADSTADVKFDMVDSVVNSSGVETGTDQADQYILTLTAKNVTTAAEAENLASLAFILTDGANNFGITINGTVITTDVNSATSNNPDTAIDLDSNETLALAQVAAAATITRAASVNVDLSAHIGANPTLDITVYHTVNTATNGENLSDAAAGARATAGTNISAAATTGTYMTLTVGSLSVTATAHASAVANSATTAGGTAWTTALAAAWNAKYGGGGVSNTMSLVDTATVAANVLTLPAKGGSGRRAHEMAVSLSLTTSGTTDTADWKIGATDGSTDNKLVGGAIILVLKETVAGAMGNLNTVYTVQVTGTASQLTTTLLTNSSSGAGANTSTTANIYPTEARGDLAEGKGGDAVIPENDVEEVSTPASSSNRVAWLG
ncbi:MAG: beta strand repeat-containing protein [Flavobacteriaceae bacterium]